MKVDRKTLKYYIGVAFNPRPSLTAVCPIRALRLAEDVRELSLETEGKELLRLVLENKPK